MAGPSAGALWAPHEGSLDPVRLVEALRADARAHSAVLIDDEAGRDRPSRRPGHRGHRPQARATAAGAVLLAAGAWVRLIGASPGPMAVEPVRGQMVALPWPDGRGARPSCTIATAICWREATRRSPAPRWNTSATMRLVTSPGRGPDPRRRRWQLCPPRSSRLSVSRSWAGTAADHAGWAADSRRRAAALGTLVCRRLRPARRAAGRHYGDAAAIDDERADADRGPDGAAAGAVL